MIKKYFMLMHLLASIKVTHESYIRTRVSVDQVDDDSINEPVEVRDLEWTFIQNTYDDDRWYNSYDLDDIPDREYGDVPDFIRDTDLCFGNDGTISRKNCPPPPDCSQVIERSFGKAMLCINRAPLSHDQGVFYIAAMKCIPRFENCDKCFCGTMRSQKEMDGYCKFDETGADDDRVDFNCDELDRIEMMGHKYSFLYSNIKNSNVERVEDDEINAKEIEKDDEKDAKEIEKDHEEGDSDDDGYDEEEAYFKRFSKGGFFSLDTVNDDQYDDN